MSQFDFPISDYEKASFINDKTSEFFNTKKILG